MRDEASPSVRPTGVLPPAGERAPLAVRPSLPLRVGASVALGMLVVALGTALVVPSVLGRPDAPGPLPSAVAVVLSIAAVALVVGCWRVRLWASAGAVVRVRLFSDAQTIRLDDARRIQVSTALDTAGDPGDPGEPGSPGVPAEANGNGSGSILPTIVVTGRSDATIVSRESRREADALLPHLLDWSRQRPELVKDARTLRFLTAYGRANP